MLQKAWTLNKKFKGAELEYLAAMKRVKTAELDTETKIKTEYRSTHVCCVPNRCCLKCCIDDDTDVIDVITRSHSSLPSGNKSCSCELLFELR